MDVVLKYDRSTGAIRGIFQSVVAGMLDAQILAEDPDFGYLRYEGAVGAEALQRGYFVQEAQVVAKTVLTLAASPNPFDAHPLVVCTVTVTPFVPCTLNVDGTEQSLTDADQTLELTSQVPHTFQISLVPLAGYQADPLRVEAV